MAGSVGGLLTRAVATWFLKLSSVMQNHSFGTRCIKRAWLLTAKLRINSTVIQIGAFARFLLELVEAEFAMAYAGVGLKAALEPLLACNISNRKVSWRMSSA